jgi:PAS domain S-box-containing protein
LGLLGTVLFPSQHGYRELFSLMVITCFVGGSITSYASVKWAHRALALPAIVPPAIYIFFVYDGVHLYAGGAALFFCFAVTYYAIKLNRDIEQRLRLQIQNQQLLSGTRSMNDSLARENQELAHRAAVRLRSKLSARDHAYTLATHFENTPLPVLECDPQYRLLAWNRAAEKVFGYDQAEALGKNLAALLLPHEKRAKAAPFMAQLFQEKSAKSITTVAIAKGGRLLRLTCHVTPIFTQSGDPLHIAVILSDMEDAGGLTQVAQVA